MQYQYGSNVIEGKVKLKELSYTDFREITSDKGYYYTERFANNYEYDVATKKKIRLINQTTEISHSYAINTDSFVNYKTNRKEPENGDITFDFIISGDFKFNTDDKPYPMINSYHKKEDLILNSITKVYDIIYDCDNDYFWLQSKKQEIAKLKEDLETFLNSDLPTFNHTITKTVKHSKKVLFVMNIVINRKTDLDEVEIGEYLG